MARAEAHLIGFPNHRLYNTTFGHQSQDLFFKSVIIAMRSSSDILRQPAISGMVRRHPTQQPSSILQINVQGVMMLLGDVVKIVTFFLYKMRLTASILFVLSSFSAELESILAVLCTFKNCI